MLRYEQPRADLMGVLDNLFIFREFILPGNEDAGTSLLYHMMEYHLDPELHNGNT